MECRRFGMSVKNATNALSLRGAKRRGNLESGLPRYARSDGKEGYELVAWFDRVWTYGFAYGE